LKLENLLLKGDDSRSEKPEKNKVKLRHISSKNVEIKKAAIKSSQIERVKKKVTRSMKLETKESRNAKESEKK